MAIFLIQHWDQNENGVRPYLLAGKANVWVDEQDLATRHTPNQKKQKEANRQVPERADWVAIPRTLDNFIREYELVMRDNIRRNPYGHGYDIGLDGIQDRVRQRIAALREGDGTVGPDIQTVAKRFDIKPTLPEIQAFLRSESRR
jgi:hypothetical protein